MREVGKVLRFEDGLAVVEVPRSEACRYCRGCYLGLNRDKMLAEAQNQIQAKIGDEVVLEMEPGKFVTAAFVIYLIPVIFLLIGYFIGDFLAGILKIRGASMGIIFSLSLFALAYVAIGAIDRKARASGRFDPKIVQILKGAETGVKGAIE